MCKSASAPCPLAPERRALRARSGGRRLTTAVLLLAGSSIAPLTGQVPVVHPDEENREANPLAAFRVYGWNSPRAVDMARRAIAARAHAFADSSLRSFYASAEGHVYFLGEFQGDRELVRADQIALDVLWQSPDRARQVIVGRRHEIRLPTNIQYHIDHLSLVLDNYGDQIRLGQGEEVWNALHPAASGALEVYDYRLTDSLEIEVLDRTSRVYSLDVRPRDPSGAAVVGTIFVDRTTGAIVRMRLTFTGASYRDDALESIHLDLRSALWQGKYWLPAEQDVEIRRKLTWLNFPVGGVIRTHMQVLDYVLNEPLPITIPPGERVASLPADQLADFDAWERDLFAGPIQPHERSDEELAASRRRARQLVSPDALLGGERLQVYLPDASSALRARRSEGLLLGSGGVFRLDDRSQVSFWGGYPFESGRPELDVELSREWKGWTFGLHGAYRSLSDVGTFPAASGMVQTLGLAFEAEDYSDPYFANGIELSTAREFAGGQVWLAAGIEEHDGADLVLETVLIGGSPLRAIRPIDEGTLAGGSARLERALGRVARTVWTVTLAGEAGVEGPGAFGFTRARFGLEGESAPSGSPWDWRLFATVGVAGGDLPAQRLFLIGGRGSLPGYGFREFGGDRMALGHLELARDVVAPWVRLRLSGNVGWTDLTDVGAGAAARFGAVQTGGARTSVGVGLGLFWDLLRVDVARALDRAGLDSMDTTAGSRGDWVLMLSIDPAVWGVL